MNVSLTLRIFFGTFCLYAQIYSWKPSGIGARRLSTQTLMARSQACFHHEGVKICSNSSHHYRSGRSPRCLQKHQGGEGGGIVF